MEAQAQAEPIKVAFGGRRTGMGAYTRYRIFSLRRKAEIEPHRTERSRTGNHWTDYWFLLSGKYFICWQDISNSGKHSCGYGLLVVGSPFIQLISGELILAREVKRVDYKTIRADGKDYELKDVVAYSQENYGIARWNGKIPEFAQDAICECIVPRRFAD